MVYKKRRIIRKRIHILELPPEIILLIISKITNDVTGNFTEYRKRLTLIASTCRLFYDLIRFNITELIPNHIRATIGKEWTCFGVLLFSNYRMFPAVRTLEIQMSEDELDRKALAEDFFARFASVTTLRLNKVCLLPQLPRNIRILDLHLTDENPYRCGNPKLWASSLKYIHELRIHGPTQPCHMEFMGCGFFYLPNLRKVCVWNQCIRPKFLLFMLDTVSHIRFENCSSKKDFLFQFRFIHNLESLVLENFRLIHPNSVDASVDLDFCLPKKLTFFLYGFHVEKEIGLISKVEILDLIVSRPSLNVYYSIQ